MLRAISDVEGIFINPDYIEILTIHPYLPFIFWKQRRWAVVVIMRSGYKQYVRVRCNAENAFRYARDIAERMGTESTATIKFEEPHPHVS